MSRQPVLQLDRLSVRFATADGEVEAVRELSLSVHAGECLGVVGESGAGKSQAFLAVMGLLPANAIVSGRAWLGDEELLGRRASDLDRLRGSRIAMVFQDPGSALTPHMTVGDQIAEPIVRHEGMSWRAARRRAVELLEQVRMPEPARRARQFPHELSGGMRQRVMIAMALACEPAVLIADEPTTAIDVTLQAQILALLADLRRSRQMALVLVTHDFGVVAGMADRVAVLRQGRLIETGPVGEILRRPADPYTRTLLQAAGRAWAEEASQEEPKTATADRETVLTVSGLSVDFRSRGPRPGRRLRVRALHEVNLDLRAGETLGIVGESGSGKSTLARAIVRLVRPTEGQVVWMGRPVESLRRGMLRRLRRELQIVFQDPASSLDPRMTAGEIVAEPLLIHRPELQRDERLSAAADMLARVGLGAELFNRYPHELSGGQCQRVAIARAMILRPRVVVCDEPVSSLDVIQQAQIVSLLASLQREHDTAIVFISHDLAAVRRFCDRVLVLYLGRMVELAPVAALYERPLHPYTRALLAAMPVPDPDVQPARFASAITGEVPSALAQPAGCTFHPRCPHANGACGERPPVWEAVDDSRGVACHRWREWLGQGAA